ncbi:hypothetical protein PCANC_11826 [Puccinia coronata f. sp. avenae]|uniref:Uncharacterized protein n=1 Tax=Puccinia coronata f. sp. avenae TaxID=200324 RepID=A0A2N5VLQ1_9BASI|nr:hypothetical protein PCANC_11826 [Puccinia coronata f. sp. avenae]PLW50933.1 hypothetical protein PCASD_01109 [Puccinia coronata f. sp. avenae]
MASKPPLTTHNLASLQLAFKSNPISPHTVLQQFINQLFTTMNPTTRNHILVAKTQIVSHSQFARLEADQAKHWEIPTQFRMTQVDHLDGNPDSNAPLGAANQSATTTFYCNPVPMILCVSSI